MNPAFPLRAVAQDEEVDGVVWGNWHVAHP